MGTRPLGPSCRQNESSHDAHVALTLTSLATATQLLLNIYIYISQKVASAT